MMLWLQFLDVMYKCTSTVDFIFVTKKRATSLKISAYIVAQGQFFMMKIIDNFFYMYFFMYKRGVSFSKYQRK